ncbi:acetolactate synthase isozyme 3 small subunit [bacterium BMS3Abin07]|nr:acetolactate synthase isozyme 3 small subunit [bacterium BMS3Abin07]GBE32118.1 acetolactate synthase isozyme 3 small subunit [bacterium BMS3Bbin05]HDL21363.1 acetolactate synthase small subunit [Nitrospirota bacterium]HDO23548.1 acetolactate synthase small subunit [Nitrospirota bacterium]HDZ88550.1 acetolactate synthase small subunit [Nitrospirota bacterium]
MRHTISVLVENKFGVLSRVSGLFSGRGYNIESLSVGETTDPQISTMTVVTRGDDRIIEQITKQLNKLIDVIKVVDLVEVDHVEREMILIKVAPKQENKAEVLRLAEIFRGRIVDSSQRTYTVEITGDEKKIEAFIELMRPIGIKELVRTGRVAMAREGVKPK